MTKHCLLLVSLTDALTAANNMCFNVEGCNLTGHPCVSINCSFVDELPVGLMMMGKHRGEVMILKVAQFVEKLHE